MSVTPVTLAAAALRLQAVDALTHPVGAAGIVPASAAPSDPPAPPTAPLPAPAQTLDVARAAAAGRQASLAPLLANLAQALTSPDLPPPFRAAITQVLALRTPADGPITAETIRRGVAQSGLFLEARIAHGQPATPDLKAALLTLLQSLLPPAARPRQRAHRPDTPPPVRGGTLAGHAPAATTLPRDGDLPMIAETLRGETEQAVARQVLHQLASLPEGEATKWLFELPLATPQGTAIAQFEIERDEPGRTASDAAPAWRARFSLDIEPLGPVHVHLSRGGDRMAVNVWAEREGGLERLRAQAEDLAATLDAEVVFRAGAPPASAPGPGQFVDQTS